jgi:hypothetical protein
LDFSVGCIICEQEQQVTEFRYSPIEQQLVDLRGRSPS